MDCCYGASDQTLFRFLPAALFLCATIIGNSNADEATNLRLTIAWGGGESQQWDTTIRITDGTFSNAVPIGLDADIPGSIDLNGSELHVTERRPHSYNGIDVTVSASLDSELIVELVPDGRDAERRREVINLKEIVGGYHSVNIDERHNSFFVHRTPGDRLRVEFSRDSLVFSPSEKFSFTVVPHHVRVAANSSFECRTQLLKARSNVEVASTSRELHSDEVGNVAPVGPIEFDVPDQDGVYDLVVSLTKKRRFSTPFIRTEPAAKRNVQIVVVGSEVERFDSAEWQQVLEINPDDPGWWDKIKRLPQLKLIPGFGRGPLGNGRSRTRTHRGQRFVELDSNGWQAYPLPITDVSMPHIVEVEYPNDLEQALGISVVEPNMAGRVVPIGLDTGVQVSQPKIEGLIEPKVLRHRLIVWPRSSSPLLVLTNQHTKAPVIFGRIRVLAGPANLPSSRISSRSPEPRVLAAYFDKPLIPENFGASKALDPGSSNTRPDWKTFYAGGNRLTEYLEFVGYNAAVASVFCEGSTIYPSKLLQPTAAYDSGTLFVTGQDPVRKDVLEMLFRQFDRKHLKLIPALRFSTPLPELERTLRRHTAAASGIELVNDEGRTWLEANSTNHGLAPYYNPLDARVQKAMINVINELSERYGHHQSFAGIALQLGPYTFAQLPGETWGYDDSTIGHFQSDRRVRVPGKGSVERGRFLKTNREARTSWLQWRAEEMASLYKRMLNQLQQKQPDAKLYIAAADSLNSQAVRSAVRPILPPRQSLDDSLLQIGINPKQIESDPDLILMRPQRLGRFATFNDELNSIHLSSSASFDRLFERAAHPGAFFYHAPKRQTLPSFEQKSPFGAAKTQMLLVPHVSPSGTKNRERFVHSLATLDTQTIVDGGWMIPLGQEDAVREFAEVYRKLPAKRFRTVRPSDSNRPLQGIVVRELPARDRTYSYVINDSPWPVQVQLDVKAPATCRVDSLNPRRPVSLDRRRTSTRWAVELEPFDLVGAVFNSPNVAIADWQAELPDGIVPELRRKVAAVDARVDALKNPIPLKVLSNPGFESPNDQSGIIGWVHARPANAIDISTDEKQHKSGKRSLRLSVRGNGQVGWVRSRVFPTPKTGRVFVTVWLRIDDPKQQPPLRLAIEGRLNGQTYYQYASVGLGDKGRPLSNTWQQYLLPVDDLPTKGLTDLRVGFDMMKQGTVWIDDVHVYDFLLYDNQPLELLKMVALAKDQLNQGKVVQCQRFLDSYWPRFLLEHVEVQPRVARNPPSKLAKPPKPPETKPQESKSVLDRVKLWPNKLFRF